VRIPLVEKTKVVGAVADQPAAPDTGAVALSVIKYPVTPILSVAVNALAETERDVAVAGMVNVFTVGTMTSGSAIVTAVLLLAETLPAASLAQAKTVHVPLVEKTKVVGAVANQPTASAVGEVELSVIKYPVTPILSVAVNALTETESDAAVAGMLKVFTVGAIASEIVLLDWWVSKPFNRTEHPRRTSEQTITQLSDPPAVSRKNLAF